jgi:hypothetical protein
MLHCASKTLMVVALTLPAVPVEYGVAARYHKGTMERVARVRHMQQPRGTCMIARLYPRDLGRWYTVTGLRTGHSRRCLTVDYSHPRDRASIARRGIVAELRHEDAAYICGSVREPPRMCPVLVQAEERFNASERDGRVSSMLYMSERTDAPALLETARGVTAKE